MRHKCAGFFIQVLGSTQKEMVKDAIEEPDSMNQNH